MKFNRNLIQKSIDLPGENDSPNRTQSTIKNRSPEVVKLILRSSRLKAARDTCGLSKDLDLFAGDVVTRFISTCMLLSRNPTVTLRDAGVSGSLFEQTDVLRKLTPRLTE